MLGKPLLQLGDDVGRFGHGKRRLREIGQLVAILDFDRRGVLDRLHQAKGLRGLPHRADDLVVPRMPDQNDRVAVAGETDRLAMHLGHQRTGGVDRFQLPGFRLLADLRRDAVGGKEQIGTLGNLRQVVDEDHPFVLEMLDNPAVVDDFVVDVNRCAVKGNGLFQALDRHIHSGTKAAGGG